MLALLFTLTAQGSGLDLLEVGGAWGTPGATDATAIWWNPAGLAAASGTRFTLEVAPTLAGVYHDRTNPDYVHDPAAEGPPEADYSGESTYRFNGAVPFFGIASDFGVDGLGVGAGLYVPTARGGTTNEENPVGRYHLRDGKVQAIYGSAGLSYSIAKVLSIGVSGSIIGSSYRAHLDTEVGTALNDGIADLSPPRPPAVSIYSDTILEDPNYSATIDSAALSDTALTFGAGLYLTPTEELALSVAYQHGARVENEGETDLAFGCPPNTDILGRIGASSQGICDADVKGRMTVGYNLPGRVQGAVVVKPSPEVRLEGFGGAVLWSQFTDYDIDIDIDADTIPHDDPDVREETAALVSQTRQWARDNKTSFFAGLDGKWQATEWLLVGARGFYDRAAVPDYAMSPNNFDTDTIGIAGLAAVKPFRFGDVKAGPGAKDLELGLSFTRHVMRTRTVTDSAFDITVYPGEAAEDRWFYPQTNGEYGGQINRFGISLRGQFGDDSDVR